MPVVLNVVETTTALGITTSEVVIESASEPGPAGPGVPTGGTAGQVLTKDSGTDYDTSWQDASGGGGGGAPDDATYLVTTAHADLSAEVVVGATPGGELGGTWAAPTVDATHSGSSHAAVQAAAEATAAAALASHEADTTSVHGIADTSVLETASGAQAKADAKVSDVAYDATTWDAVTGVAPSKNAVRDKLEALDAAKQPLDADLTALAAAGNSAVLAATTASFLTADETKLDGIEAGADVTDAVNVAAAGAVMESDYDANTILTADSDNTPAPLTVAEQRIVGRITAGVITALTAAQVRTLINVEDGATADQSAAEILAALLTVDGSGSGLDADLLDGIESGSFVRDTGDETIAGVKTFSSDPIIPDEAYGAGWNGSLEPPTKNAVYDKVEALGGDAGGLLAAVSYRPGSDTNVISTTSTSFVDADATNLAITFTAPASGNVVVKLTGLTLQTSGTQFWALRDSGGDVANTSQIVSSLNANVSMPVAIHMTGLTPTTSYTFKWAIKVTSGTANLKGGPTFGSCVMEVLSAP